MELNFSSGRFHSSFTYLLDMTTRSRSLRETLNMEFSYFDTPKRLKYESAKVKMKEIPLSFEAGRIALLTYSMAQLVLTYDCDGETNMEWTAIKMYLKSASWTRLDATYLHNLSYYYNVKVSLGNPN